MKLMISAAEDGSEHAMLAGHIYEEKRNLKIKTCNLEYEPTDFFQTYSTGEEILAAIEAYNDTYEDPAPSYTEEELYLLAKIIYAEAGSSWLSDEQQLLVGNVVLNRVASPEFPNTIKEVIYQKGQYYGVNSNRFKKMVPGERELAHAKRLLDGERFCPTSVVFQANFKQGSGVWKAIPDKILKTTYFCYSSRRYLYED